MAERAADRLRSGAPGLGRITVRAKNSGVRSSIGDNGLFAAESAFFAAGNFFTNSAYPVASALGEGRTLSHERYHDTAALQEHLLSAEGPESAVQCAARVLRSSGGRSITFANNRRS